MHPRLARASAFLSLALFLPGTLSNIQFLIYCLSATCSPVPKNPSNKTSDPNFAYRQLVLQFPKTPRTRPQIPILPIGNLFSSSQKPLEQDLRSQFCLSATCSPVPKTLRARLQITQITQQNMFYRQLVLQAPKASRTRIFRQP
jgi:hypothetical protein